MLHTNNIFELFGIRWDETKILSVDKGSTDTQVENPTRGCLLLRGQMKFMSEWDAIAFLGTPTMENVDAMWDIGLFLNDLSMHDSSRDMVLAGEQQAAELKLALEQRPLTLEVVSPTKLPLLMLRCAYREAQGGYKVIQLIRMESALSHHLFSKPVYTPFTS
ncbi:unnamed protein product [Dicrocoelium dendriticum]|nr:unnamed protein product [Dicrocoelium dendriticum]